MSKYITKALNYGGLSGMKSLTFIVRVVQLYCTSGATLLYEPYHLIAGKYAT
jgi:hypothetical protein